MSARNWAVMSEKRTDKLRYKPEVL